MPPDWIIIFIWIFTCVKCSSWTYRYKNIEETIMVCIPKILMTQNTMKRLHSTLLIPLQVKIKYSTLLICLQVKIEYGFCYKAKVILDIIMLCLSSRSGFPCNPIPHPPSPTPMKLNFRITFIEHLIKGFGCCQRKKSTRGSWLAYFQDVRHTAWQCLSCIRSSVWSSGNSAL